MPNKIMVAVNVSDGAERALAHAIDQATITNASLDPAYVIHWSRYSSQTPEELEGRRKRRETEIQSAIDSILAPHVVALKDPQVQIEPVVRHGEIEEALGGLATQMSISQNYIGPLGESSLRCAKFGSVTAAHVQSSTVPATVVP